VSRPGHGVEHTSKPARLGTLEAQVMDVVWDEGASTIREVINHLESEPAYTTIATVLANLERKGLVRTRREGRSVRYLARRTREQHAAALMGHALDTSHDWSASILHFVDSMPEADVALLRDYLRHRENPEAP